MRVLTPLLACLSIALISSTALVAPEPVAAAPAAVRHQAVVKKPVVAKKPMAAKRSGVAKRHTVLQRKTPAPAVQDSRNARAEAAKESARPAAKESGRPAQREPFTAAELQAATIAGIPDARFWADSEQDFVRALPTNAGPWLVLSGGGADGAFGAGLLNGWGQSGSRPEFTVVTGVSTGGLLATFAFLGSRYDEQLRERYTNVTAADVFEIGSTGESLFDTWPLKELIGKQITPELLEQVAEEHRRGRRLFVVTSNLDAERPVVWNMGAIAAHGGEAAGKLFRNVLLASASLPGLFPPVVIESEAGGRILQELHADGALGGPFFVAPPLLMSRAKSALLPATELYIVLNSKLAPDFYMAERNTAGVLGRSVSAGLKMTMSMELSRTYAVARREGIGFHVAYVEDSFPKQSRKLFDPEYMRALFDHAAEQGRNGTAFRSEPPGS
jgi:hypothetical protein